MRLTSGGFPRGRPTSSRSGAFGRSLPANQVLDLFIPMVFPQVSPAVPTCSARGCRAPAVFELRWRNPKIHDASRVKVWLACAEHRDSLSGFLSARGFPLDVVPFGA